MKYLPMRFQLDHTTRNRHTGQEDEVGCSDFGYTMIEHN